MTNDKKTRSQLKRDAIIQAAKAAFKEFGVQGTSMDKLAEMAQVSKRTVYNHFATKEALVMHLVSDMWQQAMQQGTIEYNTIASLKEQLYQLVKAEINIITTPEYIDLSRVVVGHLFYSPEELQKEIEKLSCQESSVQLWVNAAIKDNKLTIKDSEFAVSQLHSLIKGSCFWPQLLKVQSSLSTDEKEFIAQETTEIFLKRYQIVI